MFCIAPLPDVEHDGPLHPGDHEVGALADDVLLDAGEAVEDDGAVAAVHVEQGRLHHAARHRQPHAKLAQTVEDLSHAAALRPRTRDAYRVCLALVKPHKSCNIVFFSIFSKINVGLFAFCSCMWILRVTNQQRQKVCFTEVCEKQRKT